MKSTHWMDYLDNNHVYKWGSYLTFDFLLKNGSTEFSLRRVKHNRKHLLIEWNSTIVFYNLPFFGWVQNRMFYVQHQGGCGEICIGGAQQKLEKSSFIFPNFS